jgi:hypothetical protein
MNCQDSVSHYAMRCRRPALGWLWFLLLIMSTNIPVLTHLVPKESTKKIDDLVRNPCFFRPATSSSPGFRDVQFAEDQ